MSEIIDQIIGMANSLDEESRDKDRFELWAIEYNKLGKCKCCVCVCVNLLIRRYVNHIGCFFISKNFETL